MPVFNRHQQRNTVEQLVEEYTNLRITRRQFMQRALAVGLSTSAAVTILESCGSSGGVSGNGTPTTVKSIDSLVVISDGELDKYNEVNAAFTAKSGIKVNVESTRDLLTVLNTRIRGNNPPDIAAPTPALLNSLAGQGKLLRLDTFLDMNSIHSNYTSAWTDIVTINGGLYGVPFLANSKGCIWYSPKQFSAHGFTVPKTWSDLITLSNQIAAKGLFPWSMGVESGAASGWSAADWIDQIFLTLNGPDLSDKWVAHKIPWTDASVKNAFTYFGQIAHGNHYINGAPQSILATNFQPASFLPFDNPPKAFMYYLGDFTEGFITTQFPGITPGTDFDFFPWPTLNPTYAGAVTGGVDLYVALKDNNGTRQYMQYLYSAEAQEIWVKKGGKTSPNKSVSLSAYPDAVAGNTAKQLTTATSFRVSQDDSMPAAMETAFWKGCLSYIQNPSTLDSILSGLENTASSVYTSS